MKKFMSFSTICVAMSMILAMLAAGSPARAADKPNILVIIADDVGMWNISAYHRGLMGGRTPNLDRIAKEGALFTDYYSQQTCTAGRASFITGQHPYRVGLLKVGMPGAKQGMQAQDATIAELLKPHGYMTAQIGKNHLGDRNEHLPTVHGFDEFYGNLYHLNAEEEPEDPDYPKNPEFRKNFGPRGLLDCKATNVDDATVDPRFGRWGKQTCKDTGPITRKRMETAEEELLERSLVFIDRAVKAKKPFFLWHNPTRMHVFTRLSPKWENKSGYGLFDDNASINAVRVDNWKIHFKIMEGNLAEATLKPLNMPQVINLRQDPFERFPRESNMYFRWYADKMWTLQKEMRKLCGKEVFMSFGQASLPLSG
jgi:hypothetical protein